MKILKSSSKFGKLRQNDNALGIMVSDNILFYSKYTTYSPLFQQKNVPASIIFTKMISLWFIWVAILVCCLEFSDITKMLIKMLTRTDCKSKFLALKIKNVKNRGNFELNNVQNLSSLFPFVERHIAFTTIFRRVRHLYRSNTFKCTVLLILPSYKQ